MMPGILGKPTIVGKKDRGASSPAIPALMLPLPLSIITAGVYSSVISFKINVKFSNINSI